MLNGLFLFLLGLAGMVIFGFSIFFNGSLAMIWIYLELCGLCLIPFFFSSGISISFVGLFYYVVFSGMSSCLLLMGLLLPHSAFFLIGGFLMKFGVFPLWGWVYRVCCTTGWPVVWGFSTVLKITFVLFPLFLVLSQPFAQSLVWLCGIGCLILSFLFWFYSYSWKICWCHMMLSSSSVLIGLSLSGCGLSSLLWVYWIYFLWATCVVLYLALSGEGYNLFESGLSLFFFSFLLLTLPYSLSIFYKVLVCSCVFSCGLFLLLCWAIYSFSEQLYLFLVVTGLYSGKSSSGCLSFI